MPEFAANLNFLFREYPMQERIARAVDAGFGAVEILNPYDQPARELAASLRKTGAKLALINCPPPNYTGGAAGFAAQVDHRDRFKRDFRRTLRYAQLLQPRHIHIMAGAAEGAEARACFIENLRWAADLAPDQSLTIEPINPKDMPGYFLNDFAQAQGILAEVDRANLALQFDVYHAHMITADAPEAWAKHGAGAVHIQIGGIPDRHEPVSGFDFPAFFETLDQANYAGFVSAEYHPRTTTEDGLGWLPRA